MEEAVKADSKKEKADNEDAKTINANGRSAFHGKDSEENVSGADTQGETVFD